MKKIFSFMLIAAGLLISGQVKAINELIPIAPKDAPVISESTLKAAPRMAAMGDETYDFMVNGVGYNDIYAAFRACSEEHPVMLNRDVDISSISTIYVFEHSNYCAKDNYLNMNGFNLTMKCFYFYSYGSGCSLTIEGYGTIISDDYLFYIQGSTTDRENYQVLNVGKDVTINCTNSYLLAIYNNPAAYGVVVNFNGDANCVVFASISGNIQAKSGNLPQINIGADANIACEVAIYGAGYGIYHISGELTCSDCGIYAKSGQYTIDGNAKIICTDTEYVEPEPYGNGFKGGDGCAIILDSKTGYAGDMTLTITDNATVKSGAGYAITEVKTDADYSSVTGLTIESGTIDGLDGQGALNTTAELQDKVKIEGSITGGIYTSDITPYVSPDKVITYTDNGDGKYRWTIGNIPSGQEWKEDFNTENSYVQLNHAVATTTEVTGTKNIAYLAVLGQDSVIVKANARLNVGEVVLGEDAVLIIEPKAMVVVTSTQGIISTSDEQLIIKADATGYGQLLINPEVTFNTTPRATVELASISYSVSASDYAYQRFGIPTGYSLDSIKVEGNRTVAFYKYVYGTGWEMLGYLNPATPTQQAKTLDVADLNEPFTYYQMIINHPNQGTKVNFYGSLAGNNNQTLTTPAGASWVGFSNSYVAKLSNVALLDKLTSLENVAIYRCTSVGNHKYFWTAITELNADGTALDPMEAFLIQTDGQVLDIELNYEEAVWDFK